MRFDSPPDSVYDHLAAGVLAHALERPEKDDTIRRPVTIHTRYETKLWFGTVITTEDATLDPGRSITWRHVDGPLTGSVETFAIEPRGGGSLVRYRGNIRARNALLRGPLGRSS